MTYEEIEEWVDQLARKYGELACKYVETRDEKKIVEELYELLRELEKLTNEISRSLLVWRRSRQTYLGIH